ncbi:MAG: hypothetical protein ACQEQO_12290 [Thermodesulfobacteriota bacterium]
MPEKLDDNERVSLEELLMANVIRTDTIAQLLVEKGIFTEQEFFTKLKQVQAEWESKREARA